jgi:pimeloyl-ACP methyl ester carboxylesterase
MTLPLVLIGRADHVESFRAWTTGRAVASHDALEAIAALGTRVHLVGHGASGVLVASYALSDPGRVASLVLVDSIPPAPAQREALALSTVPTLVFSCGVPFGAMGTAMFDAMKSAPKQLCVLPRSGHYPWVDEPATFFRELRTFLRENDERVLLSDRG